MSAGVTNIGLHFDELNQIRLVDPLLASQSAQLHEECDDFLQGLDSFKKIADGFIRLLESLGEEVEREKMRAIGARNLVKSLAKQREAQEHQLQALILEKTTELERLRIQHQSLLKTESEQAEILDKLLQNH